LEVCSAVTIVGGFITYSFDARGTICSVLAPDGRRDGVNGTGKVVWKEALLGARFL
jgi:hypothetical protein